MTDGTAGAARSHDPIRAELLHVAFRLADDEYQPRRRGTPRRRPTIVQRSPDRAGPSPELADAIELQRDLERCFTRLRSDDLRAGRARLVRSLLSEVVFFGVTNIAEPLTI